MAENSHARKRVSREKSPPWSFAILSGCSTERETERERENLSNIKQNNAFTDKAGLDIQTTQTTHADTDTITDLWRSWSGRAQTAGRLLWRFWPESWSNKPCRGLDRRPDGSAGRRWSPPLPSHLSACSYPVCSTGCTLSNKRFKHKMCSCAECRTGWCLQTGIHKISEEFKKNLHVLILFLGKMLNAWGKKIQLIHINVTCWI